MSYRYENALWTVENWISWISASSTKPLESGERDFELVWLHEDNYLNIECEHFLIADVLSGVIFWRVDSLTVCWFIKMRSASRATMRNCIYTARSTKKSLTNRGLNIWRFHDKLEYFPANTRIQYSLYLSIFAKVIAKNNVVPILWNAVYIACVRTQTTVRARTLWIRPRGDVDGITYRISFTLITRL